MFMERRKYFRNKKGKKTRSGGKTLEVRRYPDSRRLEVREIYKEKCWIILRDLDSVTVETGNWE